MKNFASKIGFSLKIVLVFAFAAAVSGFLNPPSAMAVSCPSSISSTIAIATSCDFPATTDGVDAGINVNSGTLTIESGQTIAFNTSSSVTIASGASIVIVGTGQLVKSNLWMLSTIVNCWPDSTSTVVSSINSPGSGYVRLKTMCSRVVGTVPGAPTVGTATASDGSVSVAFTAPGSSGGPAITGYTAVSSPSGLTGTCASSPCTVSGLTNGTAYTFTVYATNGYGNGPSSGASNSATPATTPGAPTIGTATNPDAYIHVAFTAPSSDGGSAITSYTAVSSPGGLTFSGSGSPILAPYYALGPYTNPEGSTPLYTWTVYATNSVGNGPSSAASNGTFLAYADFYTVNPSYGGAIIWQGNHTVQLGWSALSGYSGSSPITAFNIYRQYGFPSPILICSTPGLSYCNDTSANYDTTYTYSTTATNGVGEGPSNAGGIITTGSPTPSFSGPSSIPGDGVTTGTYSVSNASANQNVELYYQAPSGGSYVDGGSMCTTNSGGAYNTGSCSHVYGPWNSSSLGTWHLYVVVNGVQSNVISLTIT